MSHDNGMVFQTRPGRPWSDTKSMYASCWSQICIYLGGTTYAVTVYLRILIAQQLFRPQQVYCMLNGSREIIASHFLRVNSTTLQGWATKILNSLAWPGCLWRFTAENFWPFETWSWKDHVDTRKFGCHAYFLPPPMLALILFFHLLLQIQLQPRCADSP